MIKEICFLIKGLFFLFNFLPLSSVDLNGLTVLTVVISVEPYITLVQFWIRYRIIRRCYLTVLLVKLGCSPCKKSFLKGLIEKPAPKSLPDAVGFALFD